MIWLNKTFNKIFLTLFLVFVVIYSSARVGLIDYQSKLKKELTDEQIIKFEEDVRKGEKIDLKDYVEDNTKYDNVLSKVTLKISDTIGNTTKDIVGFIFKKIEKSMNE